MFGFAVFTASVAYLAVITGAIVTSEGAGVSTSFGSFSLSHLLEWAKADGGHRITGTIVAALTLALGAAVLFKEERRWVKWLGGVAVLAVIIQAALGSLGASRHSEITLIVGHSCLAQIYFCIVVSLAIFTHPKWRWASVKAVDTGKPALQRMALAFNIIVFVQIVLVAIYRDERQSQLGRLGHWGQLGGIHSVHIISVLPHIIGGGVVFVAALWLLVRVLKVTARDPGLIVLMVGLAIMVMVQVFLGAGVYMMMRFSQIAPQPPEAIVIATVMHVALGALIFAGSVALTYMTYRYVARPGPGLNLAAGLPATAEPSR